MPINGYPEPNTTALDSLFATIQEMQRRLDILESSVDQAPWQQFTLELSQNSGAFSALALNNTYEARYRRRSGSVIGTAMVSFTSAPAAGTAGQPVKFKLPTEHHILASSSYLAMGWWRVYDSSAGTAVGGLLMPQDTDPYIVHLIGFTTGGWGNDPNAALGIGDQLHLYFDYEPGDVTSL